MNTEGMEQGSNHTLDNMAKLDLTRQYLKKKKKKKKGCSLQEKLIHD